MDWCKSELNASIVNLSLKCYILGYNNPLNTFDKDCIKDITTGLENTL